MTERWKPEEGEQYYFIGADGKPGKTVFYEVIKSDSQAWALGNCFKTEAEAEAAAAKVKALLLSLRKPVTNCDQLPKLTAEVFDRPDCPEWAKWAAVDYGGLAYYYSERPFILSDEFGWGIVCSENTQSELIPGKFTHINWSDSLVERPAKLPKWVEIGGYVYDARNGYGKIVSGSVKSCYIEFDGGAGDFVPEAFAELKQARLRPYNEDELRGLVGEKVTNKEGNIYLCTAFIKETYTCNAAVDIDSWVTAGGLLEYGYIINGKPAGVLEHLEDGEWVE